MKVIDQINGSALFAQSAFSASTATKDSLGRDITATYLTGVNLPESATWNETSNVVKESSASWSEGKTYEGISPIVVNNDSNKISADSWVLSAGNGISFTENSANKVTRIDVTAQGGDEGVNSFVHENSASILDVNSSYKANSGTFLTAIPSDVATTGDVANLEQTISETYYPKSNPSSFVTESWVTAQGYLTAHQDISNKLDSSAFSSVSGDFLTTSFSIPESATWNDTRNVVQSNSSQWAEGGGGSVSSKYGTISVDGSNIEATNKALEFKSNGFTSSFGTKIVNNNEPLVLTWDSYSQDTSIHVEAFNTNNESATLTYSSNTNVTGEVTVNSFNISNFDVQIPNATAIQFTTDKSFDLQGGTRVTAPSSFKVSELAWKSDLPTYNYNSDHKVSAINGNALVGNEDYLVEQGFVQNLTSPKGTISVLNNNKIEGTNSAIASDVIEGFVSAYNGLSVYPGNSSTLTWERYVPNTILYVSGGKFSPITLTYSADTGVTGQISLPNEGETSIEVPTNATSIVIGNESWNNINQNFTVSAADNYEIGELAWASAIPTFEYDSTNKISAINGSALAGGSDVPSGTMNVSGLEYNAVNEISAYNGSAIAQYGAEKQWLVHDDTLVHASNSAQYALGVNLSAVAKLLCMDETVLYSNLTGRPINVGSYIDLSESPLNFTEIEIYLNGSSPTGINDISNGYEKVPVEQLSSTNSLEFVKEFVGAVGNTDSVHDMGCGYSGTSGTRWTKWYGYSYNVQNKNVDFTNNSHLNIWKVIGIGRKA